MNEITPVTSEPGATAPDVRAPKRILVAAVGNQWLQDDGFGPAVAKAVFTGIVPPAIVDPNVILAPWWHGGYMVYNGTSLSSPEVAGAAALYQAVYPHDTPAQIKARILGDATVVPALKGLSVTGGRLSLTALGNTAADVNYTFLGMNSAPGTVRPTVVVNGSLPAFRNDGVVRGMVRGAVRRMGDSNPRGLSPNTLSKRAP